MSNKRLHFAQVQVLRWLQGRITDQFVKAYIQTEIESLERIGYPINDRGGELSFLKREKKANTLPGQIDIEEAISSKRKRVIIICEKVSDIKSELHLSPNNPHLVIVTADGFERAYGLTNAPVYLLRPLTSDERSYAQQHNWQLIDKQKLYQLLDIFV